MAFRIGIDVGGTFTDAAIIDNAANVTATAKAPTSSNPADGVGVAVERALANAQTDGNTIELVSLATTLATNALVEGRGGNAALILIGFDDKELERDGLATAVGGSPVIFADGGHDSFGVERTPVDLEAIVGQAKDLAVDAYAVAARFSVRNPAHEQRVKEALKPLEKPITCSHELSPSLGGPRRALTCVLNAGLTGLITELCLATRSVLKDRQIDAPLYIVRGDGSLMSDSFAIERPIETILSGPAASLAGASHLTGRPHITVADIGGTTTDVGMVANGRPKVTAEGAVVGGHQTMVEAVQVRTTGLGGDSSVELDLRAARPGLNIGPRRVRPLSSLAAEFPDLVGHTLANVQLPYRAGDLTFIKARPDQRAAETVGSREQAMLQKLKSPDTDDWIPMTTAAPTSLDRQVLDRIVDAGLVDSAGFTPTDASLVLGLHHVGHRDLTLHAADILASTSDSTGEPIQPSGNDLARWVVDQVIRSSAEAVLEAAFAADGFPDGTVTTPVVQRALDRGKDAGSATAECNQPAEYGVQKTAVELSIRPSSPLVGLGAGAPTYYPDVANRLGVEAIVPDHAPVAGAVGAAIGGIRITVRASITQPRRGQYRLHMPDAGGDRGDLQPLIDHAVGLLSAQAKHEAERAGAEDVELNVDVEERSADIQGKRYLVEATVTVTGTGHARGRVPTHQT